MASSRLGASTERADSRRNKRRILDAAALALMDNPHASVHDIAERAGLTRATVYRHFPDRDDLVTAVASESAALLIPLLLGEMRTLAWPEALDLLAERAVRVGAEHRDVVLLIAPHLEQSVRAAVAGEPIQAELEARRAAGELTLDVADGWLAVCIRTVCLAAVARLAGSDEGADADVVVRDLSLTLRRLCA